MLANVFGNIFFFRHLSRFAFPKCPCLPQGDSDPGFRKGLHTRTQRTLTYLHTHGHPRTYTHTLTPTFANTHPHTHTHPHALSVHPSCSIPERQAAAVTAKLPCWIPLDGQKEPCMIWQLNPMASLVAGSLDRSNAHCLDRLSVDRSLDRPLDPSLNFPIARPC